MSDASPLPVGLHGTWLSGVGLCWWLEGAPRPVTGRRHPRALPARDRRRLVRSWASPWAGALSASGRQVGIRLPVLDGAPAAAGETPDGLAPVRVGVSAPPADVTVLLADVPAELAPGPEVRWLRSLAADVAVLVRTGRVLPTVLDGRASWRLVPDHDVLVWRQARVASMPAALRAASASPAGHPATTVLADLLAVWVPQLVLTRLSGGGEGFAGPWRTGAELSSRTDLTPVLEAWAASEHARSFGLVLRIDEPTPALDDAGAEVPGGERWPVDVLLRIDDDAPVSLADLHADGTARDAAAHQLSRSTTLFPALHTAERDPFVPGRSWLSTWAVCALLDGGRDLLQRSGVEVLLPRDWARRATTLRLGVGSEDEPAIGLTGLLEWNWSVALGDVVLTEAELARLAEEKSELVRLRGEWIRIDPAHLARARRHVERRTRAGSTGELLGELLGDELPVPLGDVRATGWIRGLFDGRGGVPEVPQPAGLHADLRPYQLRGLAWLAFMDERGLGAVLADDMGLGKTIQVLSLLLHERERGTAAGPTLLVVPTSLLTNWAREAAKFAPSLRVLVHHGTDRARLLDLPEVDLVVTSYGVALRDVDDLCAVHWHRLVLDEAHVVKNSAGRQAGAVRRIPATHRLALTGTPVENRLLELRAVLDAVNPGILGSVDSFRRRFSVPIEKRRDPVALSRLQAVTRPFVLRREKSDRSIIADLPDKIEQVVPVRLTAEQAALYRARVEDLLRRLPTMTPVERRAAVLATMVQLKQICNHPAHYLGDGSALLRRGGVHRSGKLVALDDLLTAALDSGEQVLLFTQFTVFGDLLATHLRETFGFDVPFLQGSTTRKRRDAMVADFQAGRTPVLLLSLRAGGTGLNLTAASQVVHVDRWWNPSVENQATDRAYRIGQRRVVCVHKLMAVGTVEEKIDALIHGKSELAALAVSAGENWITELGTDALRELLTLDPEATR